LAETKKKADGLLVEMI